MTRNIVGQMARLTGLLAWVACADPRARDAERAGAPATPSTDVSASAPPDAAAPGLPAPEPRPASAPRTLLPEARCRDVQPPAPGIALIAALLDAGEPAPPLGPDAPRPAALTCALLPATGSAEAFIPAGWEQVSEASGDLSHDGLVDKALLICPSLAVRQIAWENEHFNCGACVPSSFHCAALVLSGQPDGFALWAVETVVDVSAERALRFSIDKAILSLHIHQSGHYSSSDTLLKYRARGEELRLIGSERTFMSAPAEERHVSTNWLTRWRKQRDCSWGECSGWKSSRTPAQSIRFGDGTLGTTDEG